MMVGPSRLDLTSGDALIGAADDPRDWLIHRLVRGQTFADVGGLWGLTSEKLSVASRAGASSVSMIDITPAEREPWLELQAHLAHLGVSDYGQFASANIDAADPSDIGGPYDVVHCSGVLYHCPNPIHTLRQLLRLTRGHLILTSMVVPPSIENDAGVLQLPQGALLSMPALGPHERAVLARYWAAQGLSSILGIHVPVEQVDLADYAPWWWLFTPSTLKSLVESAGFGVLLDGQFWAGRAHWVLGWNTGAPRHLARAVAARTPASSPGYQPTTGRKIPEAIPSLVYDIGMNNGDDTAYYLSRGYRVVAVEANPRLVTAARERFSQEIAAGRVTIIDKAISSFRGTAPFWANEDNDHWSSLVESVGRRDGTRASEIVVECIPLRDVMAEYGVPFYMKIDIEKADIHALRDLTRETAPKYLSVEAHSVEYVDILEALGYKDFKLIDQAHHDDNPRTARKYQFALGSSGPFGEETAGPWQPSQEVHRKLEAAIAAWPHLNAADRTWWDIHARLGRDGEAAELAFWEEELSLRGPFASHTLRRLQRETRHLVFPAFVSNLLDDLRRKFPHVPRLRALEIGSGPITNLAWGAETGLFDLTAVDPLADRYRELLTRRAISFPVTPQTGDGEDVADRFGEGHFHLVYSRNALDEVHSVQACFDSAARALCACGYLVIEIFAREAEREGYQGLRSFNFSAVDGQLYCEDRDGRSALRLDATPLACVSVEPSTVTTPGEAITAVFRKNLQAT